MSQALTPSEKVLIHQIHPLKLAVDWSTGIFALSFFWKHRLLRGLLLAVLPSLVVSFILLRWADLSRLQHSSAGRYVRQYMTGSAQGIRLLGYAAMAAGAWFHRTGMIAIGFAAILAAWSRGLFLRR